MEEDRVDKERFCRENSAANSKCMGSASVFGGLGVSTRKNDFIGIDEKVILSLVKILTPQFFR